MNYPGDTADPKDVARWMAHVASTEYGLPGILPVMTSCVELTDAWTGPGDVKNVPGYLYSLDHDSLGYFQQRPSQGWGTPEQITNADYALRKFCAAAARLKDYEWHKDTSSPKVLGRWCQAVQVSAHPGAYAAKGYPMALQLLHDAGWEDGEDVWPTRRARIDDQGWLRDTVDGSYLRIMEAPGREFLTDKDGWLAVKGVWTPPTPPTPVEPVKWAWPVANTPPQSSGTYSQMYPTRYNWLPERPDVEHIARKIVDRYPGRVWANTYHLHPPDVYPPSREKDSVDFWAYTGRGHAIDPGLGQVIFDELFNDPAKPDIDWVIWRGWLWSVRGGWQWWGDHFDHIHISYV